MTTRRRRSVLRVSSAPPEVPAEEASLGASTLMPISAGHSVFVRRWTARLCVWWVICRRTRREDLFQWAGRPSFT